MDKNCYIYQELSNDNTYNPILAGVEVELKPLNDKFQLRGNGLPFTKVSIPKKIYSLLNELLSHYGLSDSLDDFTSLLVYCQYHYTSSKQEVFNSMSEDFISERKDLGVFMEILEEYLFASNYNYLNTVSFRFKGSRGAVSIDNIFIVKEIYQSIINGYGLTKENFKERKQKILSSSEVKNTKSIENPAEWFKKQVIVTIHQYLTDKGFIQSQSLQLIDAFLTLCQIKSNNNKKVSFEIASNLKDLIKDANIKNLLHYINR